MTLCKAYIGLGSNLDNPLKQMRLAHNALGQVTASSSIYRSAPMGDVPQDDYLNAVVELETELDALSLLDALQSIENEQRRVRNERWGPRTIDCDLLLFGEETINSERLTVPHYGLRERNFVLYPLAEIAPELCLPDGTHIQQLLKDVKTDGIHIIEQF